MVDRNEQIRVHGIGPRRALEQASRRRSAGDQQHCLFKSGIDQGLLDHAGELEVEGVFGHPARAHRAWHIDRMVDIDHDAERGARAVVSNSLARACGVVRAVVLAANVLRRCRQQSGCENNAELPSAPSRA